MLIRTLWNWTLGVNEHDTFMEMRHLASMINQWDLKRNGARGENELNTLTEMRH